MAILSNFELFVSLMLSLNRMKRNPVAHRNFSREEVKEAAKILVEFEYDVVKVRDLNILQSKLLAFWIDCELRKQRVVRITV